MHSMTSERTAPQQHSDQVRAAYEAWWERTESAIDRHIAAGETDLARLLHLAYRDSVGETPPGPRTSIIYGLELEVPYLAANRIIRDWIADTVIEHASGVDAIIEIGSGWGYNLCNIWLRGGPRVDYHALELTDAGRRCCRKLRDAAQAGPNLAIHPFDYYTADLSALAGRYRTVLVYSSHSIEQVPELPESFIEAMLGLAGFVRVLHFEPVGWQFRATIAPGLPDRGTTAYADLHRYNRNLWTLLQRYAAAGSLVIEDAQPDLMAVKVYNGTSLIRWSASRR